MPLVHYWIKMITTALTAAVRNNLALTLVGSGTSVVIPSALGWGTGGSAAAGTDETISDPVQNRVPATVSIATTNTTGDTLTITGTLTASGQYSITNIGVFDALPSTAVGYLATQLNPGATTVQVSGYANFPVIYPFDVQASGEVMTVTTGTAGSWTVTRHTNGSPISTNVIPAGTRLVGGRGTVNGDLFLKSSFPGVNLMPGDSLLITINVQFV